jgi:caspase domain-containing protein
MRRALIVGIDDYADAPLAGCVNDANAMAGVLEAHGSGSPNFQILRMTSPSDDLTRATLREAIERLFATDCDIALLYFSGHGFVRSADGYVVTSDATRYDEGVAMSEILRMANDSPVKNKIIILDCCYSGNMGTLSTAEESVAQLSQGLTVLTASLGSEVAMEQGGRGVFTDLVVAALQGGAADLRGHITPGSVYAYVDQALGAWDQRPIFRTNVTQFTSLREVAPPVPLETLRELIVYFPSPQDEHALDPSYEDTEQGHDPDNVKVFKNLQKMEGVGLIVPIGEEHMYYAAMNSTACRLTALGAQYWRLARQKKL